jgi:hypothetical protein
MADLLRFFMADQDEAAFLRFLERFRLEVYPRRVPPDWVPFIAAPSTLDRLPPEAYLSAPEIGPVLVDRVKRGPDKGAWRVDEVRSPVLFFERSRRTEAGELLPGQLWAELDVTEQTGRRSGARDRFRALVLEVERWVKKTFRRSVPKGFWIGPHAARLAKEGLVLRADEHRPGTVQVFR